MEEEPDLAGTAGEPSNVYNKDVVKTVPFDDILQGEDKDGYTVHQIGDHHHLNISLQLVQG